MIEESHFKSKIAIINIFFASFASHLTTQKHYFVTISVTCHMDFGKIIPKYQAKPLSLLLLCESAMTPLFCRHRLCIQQMNSTLTVNRQNGQKQIGQIHLLNLLLPNLPIDFIRDNLTNQRTCPYEPCKRIYYASCSLFEMISIRSFTGSIRGKISSFDTS